jgi:transcriptional regulator with XRE-family HTH domain
MANKNRRGAKLDQFTGESRALFAEERALAKVALRLSDLLEQRQLSQRDLARKLGVSEGRVSQILSADANLTIRTLARIADALDVDLDLSFHQRDHHESEDDGEDGDEDRCHLRLVRGGWCPDEYWARDSDSGDCTAEIAA